MMLSQRERPVSTQKLHGHAKTLPNGALKNGTQQTRPGRAASQLKIRCTTGARRLAGEQAVEQACDRPERCSAPSLTKKVEEDRIHMPVARTRTVQPCIVRADTCAALKESISFTLTSNAAN